MRRPRPIVLLLVATLALTGCKDNKERAKASLQDAQQAERAGDTAAALAAFATAAGLDPRNAKVQAGYAELLRSTGALPQAYRHYRTLVTLAPQDLLANRALAALTLQWGDFAAASGYAAAALRVAPLDPVAHAVRLSLDYRAALRAHDEAARETAAARARAIVARFPATPEAWQLVIDERIRAADWHGALDVVDAAVAANPRRRDFYVLRIAVLGRLQRDDAIERQLHAMIRRFPTDPALPATLVRWYVAQNRTGEAETFLRDRIEPGEPDVAARLALVQFIARERGTPAALAAIDRMKAGAGDALRAELLRLRAMVTFEGGDVRDAEAALEGLMQTEPAGPRRDQIGITLAQMKAAAGDAAGARTIVEAVLSRDPRQLGAIKLHAADLIGRGRAGDAMTLLRHSRQAAPADPALLLLMAEASRRLGERRQETALLSQAATVSNYAPGPAMAYARNLAAAGNFAAAAQTLAESLQLAPNDSRLRAELGSIHIAQRDWAAARMDLAALQAIPGAAARSAADRLRSRLMLAEAQGDALVGYLDKLLQRKDLSGSSEIAVIRAEILNGHLDDALISARALVGRRPNSPAAAVILASILHETGHDQAAETVLRDFIAQHPRSVPAWSALYRLKRGQGDPGAAAAVLTVAMGRVPDSRRLLWIKADQLERAGAVDDAIAIYRRLLRRNADSKIIANNLASLLSDRPDDPAALDEAWRLAQQLRDGTVAAFQDTYGWIAFRRGDVATALHYLRAAAAQMPADPAVQYHLAMVLASRGDNDLSRDRLRVAVARITSSTPVATAAVIRRAAALQLAPGKRSGQRAAAAAAAEPVTEVAAGPAAARIPAALPAFDALLPLIPQVPTPRLPFGRPIRP